MAITTEANIDLGALRWNVRKLRDLVGGRGICAVVKANAYGHGAVRIARELRKLGVEYLSVASVQEGIELREGGDKGRILLLIQAADGEVDQISRADLEPVVSSGEYVTLLESVGGGVTVHLKVDTGLNRQGCRPDESVPLALRIQNSDCLKLGGVLTHFAVSGSEDADDRKFTQGQIDLFWSVVGEMRNVGVDTGIIHAANSAAVLSGVGSDFDMVRPGLCLYGYGVEGGAWRPVMEFRTRVMSLKSVGAGESVSYNRVWRAERNTIIGLLPVGYADGYTRRLTGKADVWIGGDVYPVVGVICMDMCMVDLGIGTSVKTGDRAVLFGDRKKGMPCAMEIADKTDTIVYEVLCSVSQRVPRVYDEDVGLGDSEG